jgi:hypothetical protein
VIYCFENIHGYCNQGKLGFYPTWWWGNIKVFKFSPLPKRVDISINIVIQQKPTKCAYNNAFCIIIGQGMNI